jgi:molybdopterin-containing oxidoreductase family membrane subunit
MGWTGGSRDWNLHRNTSYLLALIAAPLVISVHSIVSLDFATSILPGWHSTIFPAYFVVGAVFSGFAMVQALLIVTRKVMRLEEYITINHIQKMNRIILLTGSMLLLAYFTETFFSLYSGDIYEKTILKERLSGTYSPLFYTMILTNGLLPQLLWIRKFRSSIMGTFVIALLILVGMWIERFMIIVVTLHRDFIPARWADYVPSLTEVGLFLGSLGFFFTFYLLFSKYFPIISIAETKHSVHSTEDNGNYTLPL